MKLYTYMKRNYKIALLGLLLAVASCSFTTNNKVDPDPDDGKDEILVELVNLVLNRYHYQPKNIDDDFSHLIYDDYLKSIDARKRFFLQEDIDKFEPYRDLIDDQIKEGSVVFFNKSHERLMERIDQTRSYYDTILAQPFDFSKQEDINTDYEDLEYAKTEKELKKRWHDQLKYSTLSTFYDLKNQEELKEENREDYTAKSDKELEKEARKSTRKSLDQFFSLNDDLDREDWFGTFINAIVKGFDPHTSYFAPREKERFDIQMSGSLEGIGARLQKKMDNIKVAELISGGPAWRDGELEVGDLIKKVKQEDEEKAVSIVGMPMDDAVELIKGPKGTEVTLTVKKVDGTMEDIKVVRDVVEIEDTYARASEVEKDGRTFGLINLPKFYFDVNDPDARNAATDIEKEVKRLQDEDMEGLIIDLRNNGGGSLSTVIDIAGLFIDKGPIVQVRDRDGERKILRDKDASILYHGPLVILVNELSASASEILAAAMQDYERAVIIGSEQTYGKGTVQNLLNLNKMMRSSKFGKMGTLKMTTQKFYRINGGSTQLKGVHSDVVVPDRYSYIDIGERDMNNPLPWDRIEKADYETWKGYANMDHTLSESQKRMENNDQIELIRESARWVEEQRSQNMYSLNYDDYSRKMTRNDSIADRFDKILDYETDLEFKSLPAEKRRFAKDSTLEMKRTNWHKSLNGDVYVEESIKVLEDLIPKEKAKKVAEAKED